MSQEKSHKSIRKPMKFFGWLLSFVLLAAIGLFGTLVYMSHMVPVTYEVAVFLVLILLWIITRWMMWHYHHKKRFYFGFVVTILLIVLCGVGSYYLYGMIHTVKKITNVQTETTIYGVYVLKDDPAKEIADTANYSYGIPGTIDRENTNQVMDRIETDLSMKPQTKEYEDMLTLSSTLLNQEVQAMVLNEAFLSSIVEVEGYETFADQVREITSYDITVEVVPQQATVTIEDDTDSQKDVFTVFISGIDVSGPISTTSRSDVNILAVVNPHTHQVLLVSTPRDYYVPLSISNGVKDKLTHAGIYGINTSMDTLGMLYDTKIDYYFRVNFSGFKQVIQALGGVTVESDYDFQAGGYSYYKGNNTLNADQALVFARERHAFAAGDRQRGKNQMAVITGVINGMMSPAVLSNYSSLMSGLEGSFETSIPYEKVSKLVQSQIDNNMPWDVQRYSVDGSGMSSTTYSMPSFSAYVMVPDETTVEQAKTYIEAIENGEYVSIQ